MVFITDNKGTQPHRNYIYGYVLDLHW